MTKTSQRVQASVQGTANNAPASVFAGVDTHADTHHAAIVDALGHPLADRQFPSTPAGHQDLHDFITSHGRLALVAVEGTGSYGRTLTSHLLSQGLQVRQALRPGAPKRPRGKTDTIDAYRAARAAAADDGSLPVPKTGTGTSIAIRAAKNARRQAVRAQGDTMRQLKDLLITAPTSVREDYRGLDDRALLDALAALDQPDPQQGPDQIVRAVLGCLARRWLDLDAEITQHTRLLDTLTLQANPALRATKGVGAVVAAELLSLAGDNPGRIRSQAALAAMTGTCPIPASSGRTHRHRLNRGGDRQANWAIHRIAHNRATHDPATRAYIQRLISRGKTKREAIRCLKRAITREIYKTLTNPQPLPDHTTLRQRRKAKGITLTQAATALHTWPARISELERGKRPDHDLATTYDQWLTTA
ncbi:Transposase [Actinomyces ruminicola]|uniref:Transposase n=1 Tax=Actinomyces ruminicola TaxID=332524 RepID=A0A1H0CSC2_9ACTO|nr:IS110 family transposase [Actinomyces ruminicola]SDN60778.1 Transposase [Actinomyces ruminicola]